LEAHHLALRAVNEDSSSPVVALNRAIAIGQHEGPTRGIEEICAIDRDRLSNYPFYFAALGEFEFRTGRYDISQEHFRKALAVARNQMEREFFQKRISFCEHANSWADLVVLFTKVKITARQNPSDSNTSPTSVVPENLKT
jgi:predicted RNA polymerase sigma factor